MEWYSLRKIPRRSGCKSSAICPGRVMDKVADLVAAQRGVAIDKVRKVAIGDTWTGNSKESRNRGINLRIPAAFVSGQ